MKFDWLIQIKNNFRYNILANFLQYFTFNCVTFDFFDKLDYTFLNSQGHKSVIDHFCLSLNLNDHVECLDVEHCGINLSDHSPIILSLNLKHEINAENYNNEDSRDQCLSFSWSEATDYDIDNYKLLLSELINEIYIPDSLLNCLYDCDECNHDHGSEFEKLVSQILSSIETASINSIPNNLFKQKKKHIPGWNNYVREKRECAIEWHNLWKSSNSPSYGFLFDMRKLVENIIMLL